MKKRHAYLMSLFGLALITSGCVHAISKDLRAQSDPSIRVNQVQANPEAYWEKMVVWGGVIVEAKNLKEGTLIEIVQKPVDWEGRPYEVDQSDGRFFALYTGYLDSAIYSQGREVTVAGVLKEVREKPLGEINYSYPVVHVSQLHLWPVIEEYDTYYYNSWYPYWYPYYYPWYYY
jgi:outer membrane lipoprotein